MTTYVIARTARQRPTLMHLIPKDGTTEITRCGVGMGGWSRAYFRVPIEPLVCLRCVKILAKEVYA